MPDLARCDEDLEVAQIVDGSAARYVTPRRGRFNNSPPQLGHVDCISSAHDWQNVHSKLRMRASASKGSARSHRSHAGRISNTLRVLSMTAKRADRQIGR